MIFSKISFEKIFSTLSFVVFFCLPQNAFCNKIDVLPSGCERKLVSTSHGPKPIETLAESGLRFKTDREGLIVLDDMKVPPEPHEYHSSLRYLQHLQRMKNEKLVMVTSLDRHHIPGFDGLILDMNGKIVANYSLKTIISSKSSLGPVRSGITKARMFSFVSTWIDSFGRFLSPDYVSIQNLTHAQRAIKNSFYRTMSLFGVSSRPKRPTRVVVDITNSAKLPTEHEQKNLCKYLISARGLIESVVFLKSNSFIEVTAANCFQI